MKSYRDVGEAGIAIAHVWPERKMTSAPDKVPANVAKFYEQAADSLQAGHFDAAGMMFRKVLETSTKERVPSATNQPLVKRIDALASSGAITQDMQAWAHAIRLGGNDAAHDEEPFTKDEAERLEAFCDAFLQYAYTLPAMIAANQPTA